MRFLLAALVLLALVPLVGCGSGPDNVTRVGGTVTLDGQPLANAAVEFQPEAGRPSYGTTDAEGHYTLQYTPTVEGAELGRHTVRITTRNQITDPATGQTTMVEEKLPPKYHAASELTFEVKPGTNQADFALTSGS